VYLLFSSFVSETSLRNTFTQYTLKQGVLLKTKEKILFLKLSILSSFLIFGHLLLDIFIVGKFRLLSTFKAFWKQL